MSCRAGSSALQGREKSLRINLPCGVAPEAEDALARRLSAILPHLDERQRRLALGAEADALGRGGATFVARAARVSRPTVRRGLAELGKRPPAVRGRVRLP